jgi:hypothetical protein
VAPGALNKPLDGLNIGRAYYVMDLGKTMRETMAGIRRTIGTSPSSRFGSARSCSPSSRRWVRRITPVVRWSSHRDAFTRGFFVAGSGLIA